MLTSVRLISIGLIMALLGLLSVSRSDSVTSLMPFISPESSSTATLLIVGDVMVDRSVRDVAEEREYDFLFDQIREYLQSFDMVVANLEGPVTTQESVSQGTTAGDQPGNMQFTFSADVPAALLRTNISFVTLGNNHILDFGTRGYEETKKILKDHALQWVGGPYGNEDDVRSVVVNDIRITFVSFNQFLGGSEANTISRIQDVASTSDVVIVLAHWGEEYQEQPPPYVSKWAHAFVDAGADAVFGSHPHVIGDIEEYRGATIYYSLGNFVFDQYWESRVRCGLGVGLFLEKTATGTSVTYDAVRFGMERSRQTVLGCR